MKKILLLIPCFLLLFQLEAQQAYLTSFVQVEHYTLDSDCVDCSHPYQDDDDPTINVKFRYINTDDGSTIAEQVYENDWSESCFRLNHSGNQFFLINHDSPNWALEVYIDGRERDSGGVFCGDDDGVCGGFTFTPTKTFYPEDLILCDVENQLLHVERTCNGYGYEVDFKLFIQYNDADYFKGGEVQFPKTEFTNRAELLDNINLQSSEIVAPSFTPLYYSWEILNDDNNWEDTGINTQDAPLLAYILDNIPEAVGSFTFRRRAVSNLLRCNTQINVKAPTNNVVIYIGDDCNNLYLNDDFESGSISSPLARGGSNDNHWTIVNDGANFSPNCVQTGFKNQPSVEKVNFLEATIDIPASTFKKGYLEFDIVYNMTGHCDLLIDGQLIETFTGLDTIWNTYQYSLLPGMHHIRWEYTKSITDASNSGEFIKLDNIRVNDFHPDYEALLSLYYNTRGDIDWVNNTGWRDRQVNINCDPCTWYGVNCNTDGRVIGLDLSDNNLVGHIPNVFKNLTFLEDLKLMDNTLIGDISGILANMNNLKTIHLANNAFSGDIMNDIKSFTHLESLLLSNNSFSGTIPREFGDYPIHQIRLDNNEFEGCFPANYEVFCSLGETTDFTVDGYNFNGNDGLPNNGDFAPFCGPNEIGSCGDGCHIDYPALKTLYLATNGDQWTDNTGWDMSNPEICDPCSWYGITCNEFGRVIEISLNFNNLQGTIPDHWENFTELKKLSFYLDAGLTGPLPNSLGELDSLEYISFAFTGMSGNLPVSWTNLSRLKTLLLRSQNLTGSIPPEYGNLTALTYLNFSNNSQLGGAIPSTLGNLTNLTHLYLEKCNFSGTIPPSLGNLVNTDYLWLHNNNLSGTLPTELANLSNTYSIRAYSNNLHGCYPESYDVFCGNPEVKLQNTELPVYSDFCNDGTGSCCGTPQLMVLIDLYNQTEGGNWIPAVNWDVSGHTGCTPCDGWDGISCDGNDRIIGIDLSNRNLTGNIPSTLGDLLHLKTLDLSSNNLSGSIPAELGFITDLHVLRLNNNPNLIGEIPSELGNPFYLQTLSLSHTQLSGSIPSQLGFLPDLKYLHLNNANLSGNIPPALSNVQSLRELLLHHNELSGPIPEGLGNLSNLEKLELNHNLLTGNIPATLANLAPEEEPANFIGVLNTIHLNDNKLTASCFHPSLNRLCNLDYNFSNNPLMPADFDAFCADGTDACFVLSLELSHFSGKALANSNLLQWTTSIEQNISYFQLERSYDSKTNWTTIGKIGALGNDVSTQQYSYKDEQPFQMTYYRLRIVETDGKETFSEKIYIKRPKELAWEIIPNPAQESFQITLDLKNNQSTQINIRDFLGRPIWQSHSHSSSIAVNSHTWPAGIYLVELQMNGESFVQKLVIK